MSHKPSVLLINRVYPPEHGATGRLMQDLAHALEHNGYDVSVLATGAKFQADEEYKVRVRRTGRGIKVKNTFGYLRGWASLFFKALLIRRHDVVITMTDPPMLVVLARVLCFWKRSKHVHWCQDLYPDLTKLLDKKPSKSFYNFLFKLSRRSMQKCHKVVVIGRCMAEHLTHTGVMGAKIEMIANWADFEVIAPSVNHNYKMLPVKAGGVAKKPEEMFRDDSPKFRVLYAGNIGRAHPMKAVIEAAELLREHKEIEFVFVGDQHVHGVLARERTRRELDNIKFMPYQPIEKLREIMESGDVHLVTMRPSVTGMLVPCKFYSGLTVGRPTVFVGPKESEIGRVIGEYGAGTVTAVDNPQELAEAIYHYRMNGDKWFQAQEGALKAAQAYHPNQSLHKWLELIEEVRLS